MNKDKLKGVIKYIAFFIIFLFWNIYIQELNYDEIWNYGFTYNIARGLVPYRDFNMVVTPFFPFLYAIPMLVFGHNILVFHITNVFVMLGIFYLLEKISGQWVYFFYAILFMGVKLVSPSYNLLLLFLFLLIIYLEKNKKSDYLIGFIIALCCLTKQSVGVMFILPSLLLIKNFKILKKRLIGFIIPCLVFLIYLLITKSFNQFLDLCLFGLFDFGKENYRLFNPFFFMTLAIFIINLILIIKDKKNIYNYYTFGFLFVAIPLFDGFHTTLAFFSLLFLFYLNGYFKNIKFRPKLLFYSVYIIISSIFIISRGNILFPNGIHNFEYRYINTEFLKFSQKINKYMKNHNDTEFIFIGQEGYYFRIINEEDITYLDLINRGNHGYNGSIKLLDRLKKKIKENNTLLFVNKKEYDKISQTDKNILQYVVDNSEEIDQIGVYGVFKFMGENYEKNNS